ncbi:MAG: ABC transporter permease [Vicinamibacterales bacterium]
MSVLRDLRLALRHLRRDPGYALAAVLTLGLAVGSTTVIASAVQAVLLRPVPMTDPGRLVVGWGTNPAVTAGVIELSYLDIVDLGRESRTLTRTAAVASSAWPTVLDGAGDPAKLAGAGVSGAFFDTVGTTAALGRTLGADDDQPGAPPVVVISHDLWQGRFGGDPGIVGRSITLDDAPSQVVGVLPSGFDLPRGTDVWMAAAPVLADAADGWQSRVLRSVGVFYLVGRLAPGRSAGEAADELSARQRGLPHEPGDLSYAIVATPFPEFFFGPARGALWSATAAVVVLLLLACANVSGLMLTCVSLRAHESAVRLALGASRAAIGRQWLAESLVVAVIGGMLGWLLSGWTLSALVALAPDGVPGLADAALDGRVAAATLLIVGGVALACAAGPARLAGRIAPDGALSEGTRTTAVRRPMAARATLQVLQTGLAVLLLVSAGLVVRSFDALTSVDLGFEPARTLTLTVEPRSSGQPVNAWVNELVATVRTLPGVEAAGSVYLRPLALGPIGQGTLVTLEGQPETAEAARANPLMNYQVATPGYFDAMRIPIVRGRAFTEADTGGSPRVAIVSEGAAARLWPGQDPSGAASARPPSSGERDGQPGGKSSAWHATSATAACWSRSWICTTRRRSRRSAPRTSSCAPPVRRSQSCRPSSARRVRSTRASSSAAWPRSNPSWTARVHPGASPPGSSRCSLAWRSPCRRWGSPAWWGSTSPIAAASSPSARRSVHRTRRWCAGCWHPRSGARAAASRSGCWRPWARRRASGACWSASRPRTGRPTRRWSGRSPRSPWPRRWFRRGARPPPIRWHCCVRADGGGPGAQRAELRRHEPGAWPSTFLNARLKAGSES